MSNSKNVVLTVLALVCQVFLPGCRSTMPDWQTDIDVNMYDKIDMSATLNKDKYFEGEAVLLKIVRVNKTINKIRVPELYPFSMYDLKRVMFDEAGKMIEGQMPFTCFSTRPISFIEPKDSIITIYQIHKEFYVPDSGNTTGVLKSGKYTLELEYPTTNYMGKVNIRQWKKSLTVEVVKPTCYEENCRNIYKQAQKYQCDYTIQDAAKALELYRSIYTAYPQSVFAPQAIEEMLCIYGQNRFYKTKSELVGVADSVMVLRKKMVVEYPEYMKWCREYLPGMGK